MTSQPIASLLLLTAAGLLPFLVITLTSFTKIVVVLSMLRSAIGAPQVPPTTVITALALMLSAYVMAPTVRQTLEASAPLLTREVVQLEPSAAVDLGIRVASRSSEPIRRFLKRHAHPRDKALFAELGRGRYASVPQVDSFVVLAPAFLISQLREAFTVGFLLFVPFLVVDLVISNLLLALGMQMLQPATVALPFKLLLFVMVDGWHLVARGLVLSYGAS